jgi:hypothetical protein
MKTKEEIEAAFRQDLSDLLEMYGAEAEIITPLYGMGTTTLEIDIDPKYDGQTGKVIEERAIFEIDLFLPLTND